VIVCMPWLLRIMGCPNSAHINGTLVPVEEPSTASHPDIGGLPHMSRTLRSWLAERRHALCQNVAVPNIERRGILTSTGGPAKHIHDGHAGEG
jgi:hypothetical protein